MGILKSKKFQAILAGVVSIALMYVLKMDKETAGILAGFISSGVVLYVSGHTVTDIVWIFSNRLKGKGGEDEKPADGGGTAGG